ncbi:GGDEF domain-containing protein [Halopseudomonas laoshanensis]|uniref:diguanylate cyclase n=1 Tax=Halopseudomonas laoshanensis TaxID=2268758 RepID=A0A7V7GXJ3_9GAMM|nr:GGDEF domain-containing protein [Halopseudomonas laoshanensis]KAA0696795.1 GGDEF domain-containing protein [Halopseudomonas laoshanensis]
MQSILIRLKEDFQLSIITLVGLCSLIGITPYIVFRLLEGNLWVGLVDAFLVVSTGLAVLYAWRTGDTIRPGQFLALIYSAGAVLVSIKLGVNGLFWFYTLILFNFFVVPPLQSAVATVASLIVVCTYGYLNPGLVFESHYQMTSFAVTCLIASLFASVFAYRGRRQREQLIELATLDPLTRAGNRRAMDAELDIAMADYQRHKTAYGLLVLDLDLFKEVNDAHGHKAGDHVLTEFTRIVKLSCRQSDRLFRMGGEEFVLLLPMVDRTGLEQAASHIRGTVAEQLQTPDGPVTVSIGGCMLHQHGNSDEWLHEADQCLYKAKELGRNRYIISPKG